MFRNEHFLECWMPVTPAAFFGLICWILHHCRVQYSHRGKWKERQSATGDQAIVTDIEDSG